MGDPRRRRIKRGFSQGVGGDAATELSTRPKLHIGRTHEGVWALDVLECPRCHGRMRILAAIHSGEAIEKILGCLGLPCRAPPISPASVIRGDLIENPDPYASSLAI